MPEWSKFALHADTQRRGDRHFFVFLISAGVLGLPVSFWLPIGIMAVVAFWEGGINGIADITGLLGFALLAVYVNRIGGPAAVMGVAVCLSIACLGFLPLNMPKARVFMGDIGSILLGSVFAGLIWLAAESVLDFVCMASFLFPFYVDELTTVMVRLKDGENLTKPHRRHYYQLLANEKGIAHWKVSMGYGVLQLAVGISVLMVRVYGLGMVLLLLAGWVLAFGVESWRVREGVRV